LKPLHPNYIYRLSPYLTGNALRLHNEAQPVNAVREIIAVYCEDHTEHINAGSEEDVAPILMLTQVVHIVTAAI
jgi:hypothetical protein